MLTESLVRYLHFISLFVLVTTVVMEWRLVKPVLSRTEIRQLAKIDSWYGLSAISAVGAGLALWFWTGKPAAFYSENWIFLVKVGLAVLLGILSIYPTVFFFRNKKGVADASVEVPKAVRLMILSEVILLLIIPFCATLMARGFGL